MRTALLAWIMLALVLGHKASAPSTSEAVQDPARSSVWGTVTDPSGAFVSDAPVLAVNEATGAKFQAMTDANGRYKLLQLPLGSYQVVCEAKGNRKQIMAGVEVDSGGATNVDISFGSPEEGLVSCSCSMLDSTLEKLLRTSSPRNPEAVLHISVKNREPVAGSEVWMTVVLTNISDHVISIPTDKDSGHAFEYHVGISDPCNCPIGGADVGRGRTVAKTRETENAIHASAESMVRLAPGASMTDRVDLGTLAALTSFRTYRIRVSWLYSVGTTAGERNQGELWLTSNRVSVTVKPQEGSVVGPK